VPIYIIPYGFRSTSTHHTGDFSRHRSVRILRGNPCIVFHQENETLPSDDELSSYLIGIDRNNETAIVANTIKEALEKFRNGQYAKLGAVWVQTKTAPITILPDCPNIGKNSREELICGKLDNTLSDDECGIYGMCMFEGYDPPSLCPIVPVTKLLPIEYQKRIEQATDWLDEKTGETYKVLSVTGDIV